MAPLELPEVTLVIIDNVSGPLVWGAIQRTSLQINPYQTLLIRPGKNRTYENLLWYQVPQQVETSHALIMQYDGWVLDGYRWNPEWLKYDYIGAPWPWHPEGQRVGNGGFSLRSKKLMEFIASNREQFPLASPEDDRICRWYRGDLTHAGFRFAPEAIARDFSFEREAPRASFGFHGIFNVPKVLSPDELQTWMSEANDYVRSKPEWKEICP